MPRDTALYKATIDQEISPLEIESAVAASGGLIHRVDQSHGTTTVFFSASSKRSAAEVRAALLERGKVNVRSATEKELTKLP